MPTTFATVLQPHFDDLLYLDTPLFESQLDDRVTLCWNARTSTYPVLLNEDARSLLNEFQTPSRVAELAGRYDGVQCQKILRQLLAARLLKTSPTEQRGDAIHSGETLVAWLHLTNACNLRCDYCYIQKTNDHMDLTIARASIDAIIRSAIQHGYAKIKIKYAGGESTLRFSEIIKLHAYAAEVCAHHHLELEEVILSNGTLIDAALIPALMNMNVRLMISLDGMGEFHDTQRRYLHGGGSFQQIVRNIEALVEQNFFPHISITVTAKNVAGLPALIHWILERNMTFGINFYRENNYAANRDDLRYEEQKLIDGLLAVFAEIEKNVPEYSLLNCLADRASLGSPHLTPCAAGKDYLVIDQNGKIAKCQMEIEKPVTNIFASDPLAMLQSASLGLKNLPVMEREGCRDCTWRYRCAGGCPVETFRATGRYDVKSPNCNIYKAIFPEILRLEGIRLLKYGVWV
ncbi:MAG: radical SAM protein [bacterium]